MAKRADSGEVIQPPIPPSKSGKPGKPPRRFPWRLWLYAIVMTGAAGAGAWFLWQYRSDAQAATSASTSCQTRLATEVVKATKTAEAACEVDRKKAATDLATAKSAGDTHAKDLEKQLTDLSTRLGTTKQELTALAAQKAEAEKRVAALEDLAHQFEKMVKTGSLKVTARRGSLVLSLPSEVLFKSGSADLSEAGEVAVLQVAFTLKTFPDRRFLVVGHTDDQPLIRPKADPNAPPACGFKNNWELSLARALTVTNVLVKGGMDSKNLLPSGAGEHDPIGKDRAKNRRIEIALMPAINELPQLPSTITE